MIMTRRARYQLATILSLVVVCACQQNPVVVSRFASPVSCTDPIFGARGPTHYTRRDDRLCCYNVVTRPLCCVYGRVGTPTETCHCNSRISCGLISPGQQPPQPAQPPVQPAAPPQFPGALQQYPGYPPQNPGNPPQYPSNPSQYPGNPPQYPRYPAQYPGNPPQYSGNPPQYSGNPPQNPRYPIQYPGYPPQYSGNPPQNPGYPSQYPGYPPQYPGNPPQNPGYPQAPPQYQPVYYPPPQFRPEQPGQPVTGSRPWPSGERTPTTTTQQSLCVNGARALGGTRTSDQCQFPGVANITRLDGIGVACNAVYVIAQVDGRLKRSFLTTEACKDRVDDFGANLRMEVMIGTRRYPTVLVFKTFSGPNGNAFLDPAPGYEDQFTRFGPCQRPACPYNPISMRSLVDLNDCRLVSYGVSDPNTLASDGLHSVPVAVSVDGCTAAPLTGTICFVSRDNSNVLCAGDGGAPVFCHAPSTQEWILMGVTHHDIQSCGASPEVRVIPYPVPVP